jgi:hypothetical protein
MIIINHKQNIIRRDVRFWAYRAKLLAPKLNDCLIVKVTVGTIAGTRRTWRIKHRYYLRYSGSIT